jgi:hypothetical protein
LTEYGDLTIVVGIGLLVRVQRGVQDDEARVPSIRRERLLHQSDHVAGAHDRTHALAMTRSLPAIHNEISALLVECHGDVVGHPPCNEQAPDARAHGGHGVRRELDELQLLPLLGRGIQFEQLVLEKAIWARSCSTLTYAP